MFKDISCAEFHPNIAEIAENMANFSYAFEVSTAFTILIFLKIPCAKEHYVETMQEQELHGKRSRIMEGRVEIHLHP